MSEGKIMTAKHTPGHIDCPACEVFRHDAMNAPPIPLAGLGETEDEYYSRIWQKRAARRTLEAGDHAGK